MSTESRTTNGVINVPAGSTGSIKCWGATANGGANGVGGGAAAKTTGITFAGAVTCTFDAVLNRVVATDGVVTVYAASATDMTGAAAADSHGVAVFGGGDGATAAGGGGAGTGGDGTAAGGGGVTPGVGGTPDGGNGGAAAEDGNSPNGGPGAGGAGATGQVTVDWTAPAPTRARTSSGANLLMMGIL